MGVATFTSRSIGFVRVWVITTVLGTSFLGNAYQSSNSVSNVLFELLAAGALSAALVPTFARHLSSGEDAEAERLAGGVLGLALMVMGAVSVLGIVFAPAIARLLASEVPNPDVRAQQVEVSTFLLRFFVPQVLLYTVGTIATAVLYAKRRFVVPALAPIANTVVLVALLLVFRVVNGPDPTLDLSTGEQLLLALAGTLGVLAFVAVPTMTLLRTGFRLRPRLGAIDQKLRRLLWISAWVAIQPDVAVLLGTAIVMGNHVAGGTVAYQFAWVLFLAPYAVLAQPLHTTTLPELALDADRGDTASLARRLRWALDGMAMLMLPVSAAYLALAEPAMRAISFGASKDGSDLLAAALASLGLGLFTYSAFLLFARASYALGDSRTPALIAAGSAVIGAAVMIGGSAAFDDPSARVAALGVGHTLAYLVGAIVLGGVLRRRLGHPLFPHALWRALTLSVLLGAAAWGAQRLIHPDGRLALVVVVSAIAVIGGGLYALMLHLLPEPASRREAAFEPADPDLAVEP
jgi:putative peptidoglycan lipid II flippase